MLYETMIFHGEVANFAELSKAVTPLRHYAFAPLCLCAALPLQR
jgi:hypothetical protein